MNKQPKKGLALSGGGYRATLYALGSLWRMNDSGLLTELDTITSVSGGSIAAGFLMLNWNKLVFEPIDKQKGRYRATNFEEVIAKPLLDFCDKTLDYPSIIKGVFNPWSSASEELRKAYEKHLFGDIRLDNIPDHEHAPEFVFYGTNYDTGVSVRISKRTLRDYHIGEASQHGITLAQAVCISSSFPPFMASVKGGKAVDLERLALSKA